MKKVNKKQILRICLFVTCLIFCIFMMTRQVYATDASLSIDLRTTDGNDFGALDILYLLAFLSIMPSLVLLCTCFTRIIIVFSLLRSALGTQQSPPNQVLVGLALFLTLFIMQPTINNVKTNAWEPYKAGEMTQEVAFKAGVQEVKTFMIKQIDKDSLDLFLKISNTTIDTSNYASLNDALLDVDVMIIAPSFALSELKRAFTMGFMVYIPFVIIDIIVSSVLMSMGMMMLPPASISLPFKLLVFILANGWEMIIGTLVKSFR